MGRHLVIAAAQMGPIARTESRAAVVRRMIDLMRQAKALGAEVVAYPEATLTAFFPHWFTEDEDEVDAWFERDMPGPQTQALFDEARRLGVGFHLGYCELDMSSGRKRRVNTSSLVDASGRIIGKYRKIHLPGHSDHRPETPFQNLEKRYFEVGDLGFGAWQAWGGVAGMIIKTPSGILRRSPLMDVIRDLAQEMKGYETEMGFTPASRSRVQVPQDLVDKNDPWAEIAG